MVILVPKMRTSIARFIIIKIWKEYEGGIIPVLSKNRANTSIEYNYDILTRVLFLYAKLHNGFYVQGMNEIVALMYSTWD